MANQRLSGNDVSMRDYVDGQFRTVDKQFETVNSVFEAQDKAVQAALAAAEKAVTAALAASEKAAEKLEISTAQHFDSVNEIRRTFADLVATNPTRAEMEAQIQAVRSEAKGLTDSLQAEARSLATQNHGKIETLDERLSALQVVAANLMTKDGFDGYVTRLESYRQENKRATVLAWVSMLGVVLTIIGTILVRLVQH